MMVDIRRNQFTAAFNNFLPAFAELGKALKLFTEAARKLGSSLIISYLLHNFQKIFSRQQGSFVHLCDKNEWQMSAKMIGS